MSYTTISPVTYDAKLNIILATYPEKVATETTMQRNLSEILRLIKEHNCFKLLTDFRETVLDLPIAQLYFMPQEAERLIYEEGIAKARVKWALATNTIDRDLQFFENIFRNNGYRVQLFTDFEEAKKWLLTP